MGHLPRRHPLWTVAGEAVTVHQTRLPRLQESRKEIRTESEAPPGPHGILQAKASTTPAA